MWNSHNKTYVAKGMKHGPFRDSSFLFNMILRYHPAKFQMQLRGKKLLNPKPPNTVIFRGVFTSVFPGVVLLSARSRLCGRCKLLFWPQLRKVDKTSRKTSHISHLTVRIFFPENYISSKQPPWGKDMETIVSKSLIYLPTVKVN